MKLVGRGDTTVVDAYLSPILRRYVETVAAALGSARVMFMQSNGGLTDARTFQGKDAILSGPAGGVVGMARTAERAGFARVIGFDMGGTSTDVSHYDGEFERSFETEVAGVRVRAPMLRIHTVAAGGGSILGFDGARLRVGPESAGAVPGPASLSARRAVVRHRCQRHARAHPVRPLSEGVRRPRQPGSRRRPRPPVVRRSAPGASSAPPAFSGRRSRSPTAS